MAAPTPSTRPGPADPAGRPTREARRRPRARLRALTEHDLRLDPAPVSDWASAFGDLSRGAASTVDEPVEFRIHDRTHLEFAIDYPVEARGRTYVWEAYFFVPESFRIHEATYSKKAIYEDLQSYVRYAVPEVPFEILASRAETGWLARVRRAVEGAIGAPAGSAAANEAVRELRLLSCMVRASGVAAMRAASAGLSRISSPPDVDRLRRESLAFAWACREVAVQTHEIAGLAGPAKALPDEVRFALRWCDEAVSIAIETLCAEFALQLEGSAEVEAQDPDLAERVAAQAVAEARHRAAVGYDSVGRAGATERDVEHLEFRRHVLKRFTASALWLALDLREGAGWALHAFYAVAAAVAMSFAVAAAFGTSRFSADLFRYAVLVVVAYAIKDRLKAFLQDRFQRWIARRFPDRRWTIRDRDRGRDLGKVRERAGFVPFGEVPPRVLQARRLTREHDLEECARPERVLWHEKAVEVEGVPGSIFPMLTEIFRLNLGHWLAHTDDPKRKVLFADPDDANIYSAVARRVYNVGVIYRLRAAGEDPPWHRIRVVVSRKGIARVEPIC